MKKCKPKQYWDVINKKDSSERKMGNISIQDFMSHFKELNQKCKHSAEVNEESDDPREIIHSLNDEINRPFTVDELMPLLRKLQNNKASGMDNIINEFLKYCPMKVTKLIVKLFNVVLDSGIIPTSWCIGIIVPLFKNKGSINDPDNYRGITLLSCLGKLFTSAIDSRLSAYLESTGTLGDEQAGFRSGFSTIDHVFVLHCLIDLYLSQRKRLYCAFVDYKKAFDLVDRSSLWSKLISNNINGKIFNVVYNLYDKAKSCVRLNNDRSELFNCNIGVRQGDSLSPLLFAIYLNDFELFMSRRYEGLNYVAEQVRTYLSNDDIEVFLRLFVLLYADDTIIMAENPDELQKSLNALFDYCTLWHLKVNTTKTKVVVFSRGKIRKRPAFTYAGDELDVVDDFIYLGVTLNYNGRFKKAISKQVSQAKRAMFSVLSNIRKLKLPIDISCELFDSLVLPIALYGSEVWGFEDITQIEVFHRKFLRNILGVHKSVASCMIYGETGRYKLLSKVKMRMLNFWCSLITGKQTKLSCTLYRVVRSMHDDANNPYCSKWLQSIKEILDSSGYGGFWENQEDINGVWLKRAVTLRLKDMDKQNWLSDVNENTQCLNYRIFKDSLEFESYFLKCNSADSKVLCKFRCGSHRLPCVSGRYEGIPRENRLCTLCGLNLVGDEYHYLFQCKYFETERKTYLPDRFTKRPNTLKMYQLFNSKNVHVLGKLAKFVRGVMKKF